MISAVDVSPSPGRRYSTQSRTSRDISISYSNPFQVKIGQGSCDDICGSVGFVCEPAFFPMLNVEPVLAL